MTTFDFGFGPVPAHQHPNGRGWVADTAHVDDSAYIGPDARVFGDARVYGGAWVYGGVQFLSRRAPSREPFGYLKRVQRPLIYQQMLNLPRAPDSIQPLFTVVAFDRTQCPQCIIETVAIQNHEQR